MLSLRSKEDAKLRLVGVVAEYLDKKMYLGDEGKDRAEVYRKKLKQCSNDLLLKTVIADFLHDPDSVFGTSKRLRRMIGEELCRILNIEKKLILQKVEQEGTYSFGLFSIAWPTDQTCVDVMQQLVFVKNRENEKKLRHGELCKEIKARLESSEEKTVSLRAGILEADGIYANTLGSVEDQFLMKRLFDDLQSLTVPRRAPIIKAIIADYKTRLIEQNAMSGIIWEDVLTEIVRRIEVMTFQLEKNIGASSFYIEGWLKEIMNVEIDCPSAARRVLGK